MLVSQQLWWKSILESATFIIFKKSDDDVDNKAIETSFSKICAKETHHILSWENTFYGGGLDDEPDNLPLIDESMKKRNIGLKKPKNLKNIPFFDPYIVKFDTSKVVCNLDKRQFVFKTNITRVPTRYFTQDKNYRGSTRLIKMPGIDHYQKEN